MAQGAREAVRLLQGCTVCCDAMDGKEWRMSREGRYDVYQIKSRYKILSYSDVLPGGAEICSAIFLCTITVLTGYVHFWCK